MHQKTYSFYLNNQAPPRLPQRHTYGDTLGAPSPAALIPPLPRGGKPHTQCSHALPHTPPPKRGTGQFSQIDRSSNQETARRASLAAQAIQGVELQEKERQQKEKARLFEEETERLQEYHQQQHQQHQQHQHQHQHQQQEEDLQQEEQQQNGAAQQAPEDQQYTDLGDEEPGYILLYYSSDTPKSERYPISLGSAVRDLNQIAIGMANLPLFQEVSSKLESATGPVTIHGHSYTHCKMLSDSNDSLTIITTNSAGESVQAIMELRSKKSGLAALFSTDPASAVSNSSNTYRPVYVSHLRRQGGWMEVSLTDLQLDLKVGIPEVVRAVEAINIKVFRRVHVTGKIENDDESSNSKWLPLGANYSTNRINCTVKPVDQAMHEYEWSKYPELEWSKVCKFQGVIKTITHMEAGYLQYAVGGDSLIDKEASTANKTVYSICNRKEGCKLPTSVCKDKCYQLRKQAATHRKEVREVMEASGSSSFKEARKEVKQARTAEYQEGIQHAQSLLQVTQKQCGFVAVYSQSEKGWVGTCARGHSCPNDHTYFGTPETIAALPCRLPKRKGGVCRKGAACIYSHTDQMEMQCKASPSTAPSAPTLHPTTLPLSFPLGLTLPLPVPITANPMPYTANPVSCADNPVPSPAIPCHALPTPCPGPTTTCTKYHYVNPNIPQ